MVSIKPTRLTKNDSKIDGHAIWMVRRKISFFAGISPKGGCPRRILSMFKNCIPIPTFSLFLTFSLSEAILRTYSPSAHGPPLPDALQNSTPSLSETEKLFQNSPFTFLYYTRSFQYLQSFSGIMFYFCPTALKQNFIFPNRHKKSPLLINSRDFPVSNQNLMRA